MGTYAEPIAYAGPPLPFDRIVAAIDQRAVHPRDRPLAPSPTPGEVIAAITRAHDLGHDDVFWAIRRAPEMDLATHWPELTAAHLAEMHRLCRAMTRNRLRQWKRRGSERQPTWLEVRALITGLHHVEE